MSRSHTNSSLVHHRTRRQFLEGALKAAGGLLLTGLPASLYAGQQEPVTVQQVIDLILKQIPGGALPQTVDTLKSGRPDQQVTGIVTTMFATVEVIQKAAQLGANFIIAHEPTFYNHIDETGWLNGDAVYEGKKKLLDKHGIAVWRFHDYWHRNQPDGVLAGVLQQLNWQQYQSADSKTTLNLPPTKLKDVVRQVKEGLGIGTLRFVGNPEQVCQKVGLLPGAPGGRRQILYALQQKPDLLICGEIAEWETAEYVRDARLLGQKTALIVLGHAQSEEPGMQWLVGWLQPKLPQVKVTHVASQTPFQFM